MAGIPQSAVELKVELVAEEQFHQDRVSHVERHYSFLAKDMGGIARKTALMRDKGDKLVKTLQDMSASEKGSMRSCLKEISECLAGLEDYRQTLVDRMEAKSLKPLLDYDNVCKKARDELRSCHADRTKEVQQQRTLDRTRIRDPANRKRILESDLQKAKFKRLQSSKALENYMEGFERQRTRDLKGVMGEYVHAEMLFHAKALELYTTAFRSLQGISEDEAAQTFLMGLRLRKREDIVISETNTVGTGGSRPDLDTSWSSHLSTPLHHSTQ